MEAEILYLGEVKFEAITRGHRVICDQPATNGGSDSGMTPLEFLLVSLGAPTISVLFAREGPQPSLSR